MQDYKMQNKLYKKLKIKTMLKKHSAKIAFFLSLALLVISFVLKSHPLIVGITFFSTVISLFIAMAE